MDLLDLLVDHDRWATARLLEASGGLSGARWERAFDAGHGHGMVPGSTSFFG